MIMVIYPFIPTVHTDIGYISLSAKSCQMWVQAVILKSGSWHNIVYRGSSLSGIVPKYQWAVGIVNVLSNSFLQDSNIEFNSICPRGTPF